MFCAEYSSGAGAAEGAIARAQRARRAPVRALNQHTNTWILLLGHAVPGALEDKFDRVLETL